jgi:glycosyltransferase involved in cell wall biosynthesis
VIGFSRAADIKFLSGDPMEAKTGSVLSYWRDYFRPEGEPLLPNHSTGLIAGRLHRLMQQRGPVIYVDNADDPRGVAARILVGHFWAFERTCRENDFGRSVAVYVLSDPTSARALLREQAERHGVPFPAWDLPPGDFDHEATMRLADAVLLVGNSTTLETFDSRWRQKIQTINYAPDESVWQRPFQGVRRRAFVYAATTCGLRKGFLDVIDTWRGIPRSGPKLHVIGHLDSVYADRLASAETDSVVVHGWIPSYADTYINLMRSCWFAYMPTWVEGQMGTLLEAIAAGCIPITTRASGVDDRVLENCVLVEPRQPEQHREAIAEVLRWSDVELIERQEALRAALARHHSWKVFDQRVLEVLDV